MTRAMASPKLILIVDDDPAAREELSELISDLKDVRPAVAPDGEEAWRILRDDPPAAALIDLRLPDIDGIELLKRIKTLPTDIPAVIVTGAGSIESGVEAIKLGAHDYLLKPFQPEKIRALVRQLVDLSRLREENAALRKEVGLSYALDQPVGKSPAIRRIYDLIPDIADTDAAVLITGESGTGKELAARTIYSLSRRKDRPFVVADCTALSEHLLESELFGHERGAFTGAIKRKIGRFEQARGGTIFLDEIGAFSATAQLKLLRFLQEHSFERVGGEETIKIDVRVIAATNQDLGALVHAGRFRDDLYYRVNVVGLHLPPLRERTEDIPLLARYFMEYYCRANNKKLKEISRETMALLLDHAWPGNIRELRNAIERGVVISRGEVLSPEDLPPSIVGKGWQDDRRPVRTLRDLEKAAVIKALLETDYNIYQAAKILGISRSTLYGKIRKLGITIPHTSNSEHSLPGGANSATT